MIIKLDDEINKLKKRLLEMGNAVKESIARAIKSLKDHDHVLAKQVIKADLFINRLEIEIDKICLKILALKQPAAIDLRFVVSSLKVNNDLERMGDFASRIAEDVIGLNIEKNQSSLEVLYKMAELCQEMLELCLKSFIQKNVKIAQEVIQQDKKVDRHYEKVIAQIGPYVHANSERFETGLTLINMAKCLERIGDHAKNICEDAIYLAEGTIVKHQSVNM